MLSSKMKKGNPEETLFAGTRGLPFGNPFVSLLKNGSNDEA
jgi:hypothetical protein